MTKFSLVESPLQKTDVAVRCLNRRFSGARPDELAVRCLNRRFSGARPDELGSGGLCQSGRGVALCDRASGGGGATATR
eukprot:274072-Pyramimonas_sp.AAC.1